MVSSSHRGRATSATLCERSQNRAKDRFPPRKCVSREPDLIRRREVRGTGDHDQVLPRDGDWSCGSNLGRRKTYQEKGTQIVVVQCAPWYVASRCSGETKQTTALVLERDTSRLQLQDPTALTCTICCQRLVEVGRGFIR